MLKFSKLSDYQAKKIIESFCIDIETGKAAQILNIKRNTINRWYGLFYKEIQLHQSDLKERLIGNVEVDESYFGPRRVRDFHGKRKRGCDPLKQPVFGIFMCEARGVYIEIFPNC